MSLCIVVSPAKKMNVVDEAPFAEGLPVFINHTEELMRAVQALSRDQAQELWRCSNTLADLNYERFEHMDLRHGLTAAVMSYEGIQYQHMAPSVMDERSLCWLQAHLRILSGFYGVLRPLDGVVPYRLEMQARLGVGESRNLYEFWGESILMELVAEGFDRIINVASVEYAKTVTGPARTAGIGVTTCLFGTVRPQDGRFVQRATEAKAARGTFVRWCAKKEVSTVDELYMFDERGYMLDETRCSEDTLVFVR